MKRPELLITTGALAGNRYPVGSKGLRFGRSSSNDIHVPDEELSRNHCLFEPVGDEEIRVTDLASANGTLLNGRPLGVDPVALKVGDIIEAGVTVIRVVGENAGVASGQVDLGLGDKPLARGLVSRRRSVFRNVLWSVVVLLVAVLAFVILRPPSEETPEPSSAAVAASEEAAPDVREVLFEKVEADVNGIFRSVLSLSGDGVLSLSAEDVPTGTRNRTASKPLDEASRKALNGILPLSALREVDREYVGVEPDPPALTSLTLKVVYTTRVRSIRIVNTPEPEAFRAIRENLETFVKNEFDEK